MDKEHQSVQKMWRAYLDAINDDKFNREYEAWHFCNDEESANHLAELVKSGVKIATSSLHYWYSMEDEEIPQIGDLSIITNWDGEAQCIIETVNVNIVPFKEVPEAFAYKEGEGDRSLNYWRKVHNQFFEEELKEVKRAFSEDMLVVCEEFRVVYGGVK
ncbi:ASCH domain-containing protein [Vallitalea okinawensis]|uniref:ASCH domain-containing protein n=1 Tax=Vallitalea okinawensis TaxID=2078660 RepID=UPI000CFBBF57|nr:ASCH domain-containing protein [Vallitalea okinawensis]